MWVAKVLKNERGREARVPETHLGKKDHGDQMLLALKTGHRGHEPRNAAGLQELRRQENA